VEELQKVTQKSPALEYEIVVTQGGSAEIIIEAVPAFALDNSQPLRTAISLGDNAPHWINFSMSENWDKHVLENRMIGTIKMDLEPGTYWFKVWGTDPSVNIDKIMIDFGGLEPSYSGPSTTKTNQN